MNSFRHESITGKCLQGEHNRGLQQVTHIDLWRIAIEELLPGLVILQVTPGLINRVQLGALGRQPHGADIRRPPEPLSGAADQRRHHRLPRPLQCLSTSHAFRLTPGRAWSIDTPSHMHTSMTCAEVPARTLPGHLPRLSRARRGSHALPALSA
jgi:hypothetical protein